MNDESTSVEEERSPENEVIPGSRPPHWWIVGTLVLMVWDMATPNWLGLCVLHLLVLPLAWRFLHRRFISAVTVTQAAAVAVAGVWHVFFGPLGRGWPLGMDQLVERTLFGWPIRDLGSLLFQTGEAQPSALMALDPVRLWTFCSLMAAWYFHLYLRKRLLQRIQHQHFLQQNVRRRSQEVERVNHALRDEVARRQATQHRLDQSETTFQSIMDRMNLQVARKNAGGVFTYANVPFCNEMGLTPVNVIGSTDADLYSPAIAAGYRADDVQVMTTGNNVDKVEAHPGVDGQPGFVQVFKAPEYDQHGQCIGVQVIFWDITEKHRNEIALRHSEARKRALFDAAGDAVLLVDDSGIIMEANPSASELLQPGGGRLIGRPLDHLVVPLQGAALKGAALQGESAPTRPSSASHEAQPGQVFVSEERFISWDDLPLSQRHELRLRRGDGVVFASEVSVHAIPLGNPITTGATLAPANQLGTGSEDQRDPAGRAVIIRDVTLQQQAFEALKEAKAAAEQANRTKTQFMAGISHELRTPLGGIRGLTELLTQQTLTGPARRYVNLVAQNTELLHDAIEDILDFSAIEAGRVAIAPAPIDLHTTVGDAFGCLAIRVVDLPVRLCLSIAPDVPRFVIADAKRIRQIIVNLVGNGIKFTPKGEVRLRLTTINPLGKEPTVGPECAFRIVVEDTGIGIAPQNQNRIFDAFEQADRGTNKQFGGTGLGLAIARGLAERMGGGITLESELGRGSRFEVRLSLPLTDSSDEPSPWVIEPSRMESRPRTKIDAGPVVVSVGNASIHEALVETINDTGFRAFTPAKLSVDQAKSTVHWILTGATADEAFRFRARKSGDQVLWLTRAGETPPRRAQKRDPVTIEPVRPDELRRWLAGLPLRPKGIEPISNLDDTSAANRLVQTDEVAIRTPVNLPIPTSRESTETSAPLKNAHYVMVVDDSPTNRVVIHDQLVAAGHRVETADDGPAALELFHKRHLVERRAFDCILMDLQMPGMDGTEVTQQISRICRDANLKEPPVIALTAHVTDQHRQMCRDAGMVGYVTKPIHIKPLLQEMQNVIAKRRSNVSSELIESEPPSSMPEPLELATAPSQWEQHDQWKEQLSKHCGGDESTMKSVCEAIVIEIPELIRRLDSAAKSGNQRAFKTASHTIKACLKYVAGTEDTRLASEIEKACDDEEWIRRLKDDYASGHQGDEVTQLSELKRRAKEWVQRISESL